MATVQLYAAYAGAAYTVTDEWECDECSHPGTEGTVVETHWDSPLITSRGYIARNPASKTIVVAFGGTDDPSTWAQDFKVVPAPWPLRVPGSVVIEGFLEGYLVVEPQVMDETARLADQYPDHTIVAVGHSLGGTRAALFVADLGAQYPELLPRTVLYTYGQAKCGNEYFADYMNGLGRRLYRVVNQGDVAPHLPQNDDVFYQFGTEIWLTGDNGMVVCQRDDYSRCSESLSRDELNVSDHTSYPSI
ncbi:hypothetical protein H4R18_004386 [Coemansia javaensis]|uniref:Fungal lipase-type domain-containing protein n=1 Tax=Coemansia javaensis TaxID=2761396 RepID=A0A9W8LGZ0_9FUNG|nr:hypothetical protein H4R18_004386 [Coemansia javaensis]